LAETQERGTKSQNRLFLFRFRFDSPSLKDYLELKPWGIKLASCDITNYRLFTECEKTKLPVLFSTGTANEKEIGTAVRWLKKSPFVILECVSSYPAKPEDYDLTLIPKWRKHFDCITGISDHTMSNSLSIASIAVGASVIERHFTLDKKMEGPDQSISLNPAEFKAMAVGVEEVQKSKGNGLKKPRLSEEGAKKYGRRSLYATTDIKAGALITQESIIPLRPDLGISANEEPAVLGQKAYKLFKTGEPIEREPILGKKDELTT
jgi:N,N'-diacetyllegionaminate synthase